jgi:hypothetical protein
MIMFFGVAILLLLVAKLTLVIFLLRNLITLKQEVSLVRYSMMSVDKNKGTL